MTRSELKKIIQEVISEVGGGESPIVFRDVTMDRKYKTGETGKITLVDAWLENVPAGAPDTEIKKLLQKKYGQQNNPYFTEVVSDYQILLSGTKAVEYLDDRRQSYDRLRYTGD